MARTVVTTTPLGKIDTLEGCPPPGAQIPMKYEGQLVSRTSGRTFLGVGTDAVKDRAAKEAEEEYQAALKPITEGILARTPCPGCGKLHPVGERRKAELAVIAKKNTRN